ncbi:MAG: acyltransferase family protein [Acidimicrobiia bacterium]
MTAPHQSSIGYKPALDGLRTVAVGSVIAYHFGASWAPGGFLGVDTFFVLSGYLITSLLLTEWGRHGTLRFGAFWARRARRLFPALLVALSAIAIWSALAVNSDRLGSIRADSLWTLFYSANWHFISEGTSYFDLFSEASPLRHAWSLAIEEQFYLFWPLITFGCLRVARGRPRVLASLCVAGIVGSAILCSQLFDSSDPSRAYFGTDSRASQLLVGALLAIVLLHWAPRTRATQVAVQLGGAVGAALTVVAFAVAHDQDAWLYQGGFLAFAFATAAIIAAIVQPSRTPLNALLSLRPVRWVGQVSYGLYLWHWPVQIAISEPRTGISGFGLALVRLAVTFTATTISYYVIERPIRYGALRGWTARLAAPVGAALVAVIILVTTSGATTAPKFVTADPGDVIRVGPKSPSSTTPPPTDPNATLPTRFLLVGDSLSGSLANGLTAEAASRGLTLFAATRPGCGMTTAIPLRRTGEFVPWAPNCARSTADYQQSNIAQYQPQVVLWLSSWEASNHLYDGVRLDFRTPEGDAALLADFEESRQRLTAGGATLVLLTLPQQAEQSELGEADPYLIKLYPHLNRLFRQFAAEHADTVKIVDLAEIVCPGGAPCPEFVHGVSLRPRDGRHFEGAGPAWVSKRLIDAVLEEFGAPAKQGSS